MEYNRIMKYIRKDLYGGYETYMLVGNKKEGPFKRYYKNGQIIYILNYINDINDKIKGNVRCTILMNNMDHMDNMDNYQLSKR